ncbi:TEA-domain-containing protein [Yamadazyma tenuis ATCC 10573]|uniref:TEA-domain-containing protein n=2 Tax=Candida tenuis TaxID=2315449 RepID=G3B3A0_CANTC|nr:TEA-domain-containing protein [Yamadazyma tenuis ATCC 10573]EGV64117.1 TEA-domain-containing protein [Yamadazyma tenuis ATCC 10573]
MIVDIALDGNGKQIYQVHESSKFVRREMPRSTKFNSSTTDLLDELDEEKTPIRKILGTISPSTLNQKKVSDDDSGEDSSVTEPESATRHGSMGNMLFPDEGDEYSGDLLDKNKDIWSDDVELAFEEVLSIIPKNGLNKIKISGRSCGRNELISDYILTKTGKYRTRKQVSSHIQVIKNLGKRLDVIKLINEGPSFKDDKEQMENTKKFEEIFSQINLNKSLGFNKAPKRQYSNSEPAHGGKKLKSKPHPLQLSTMNLMIENFYMSIYDSMLNNPIILSLHDNQEITSLKLKPNANISNRFPELISMNNLNLPILHNLVRIQLPTNFPLNYSIGQGLKTNLFIRGPAGSEEKQYSMFTIIYNYGKDFFKINENHIKLNDNYDFLNKFWKFFLDNEMNSNINTINHLTIKQILYEDDPVTKDENMAGHNTILKIPKRKIKHIFLWEFVKVNDLKDAVTTTSRLLLPDTVDDQVFPQVVTFNSNYYDPAGPSTGTTADSNPFTNPSYVSSAQTDFGAMDYKLKRENPDEDLGLNTMSLNPSMPLAMVTSSPLPPAPVPVSGPMPVPHGAGSAAHSQGLGGPMYSQPMQMPMGANFQHLDYDYQFLYGEPPYPGHQ